MAELTLPDLSSTSFWELPIEEREEAFALLRREAPVSHHRGAESPLLPPGPDDPGYWAITRHADVRTISRDAETFCSGQGVMFFDAPPEFLEASQSFIAMDDPRHRRIRGLVSAAFSPRRVQHLEERIAVLARECVEELAEAGPGSDVVEHCHKKLPLRLFSELMGVAEADREKVVAAADDVVGGQDEEVLAGRSPAETVMGGMLTIHGVALAMAEAARSGGAEPDSLMRALVEAEIDGQRLTDQEIAAFMVLLSVAGNDTTRHSLSHGLRALTTFAGQREVFLRDPALGADEVVRWASPVITFRRTATRDTEVGGHPIAAGEKVVLFYGSANRDEAVFAEPGRFVADRSPNPHVGFGGGGPHYCMGAALARTQIRCLVTELLTRLPSLQAGEPELLGGNFINGVKRMAVDW